MSLRLCIKCNEQKPEEEFSFQGSRGKATQRKKNRCKKCEAAYHKKYFRVNKAKYQLANRRACVARRKSAQEFVYQYLLTHRCVDCGESDPVVLDFDHISKGQHKCVCELINNGCGPSRIEAEIAKCEVRCANCHRRKTAKEFGHWRYLRGAVS